MPASKYHKVRQRIILDALEIGASRKTAYNYAKICETTFYLWMKKQKGFKERVLRSEATWAMKCSNSVEKGIGRDAKLSYEIKKKLEPEKYGDTVGTEDKPLNIRIVGSDGDYTPPQKTS